MTRVERKKGNEQWYTQGKVKNRLRRGGLEGWKEKVDIIIDKLMDT